MSNLYKIKSFKIIRYYKTVVQDNNIFIVKT